jgi:YCII-related domain
MTEITDEYMLDMLGETKDYTLMVLKQGPNWSAPDRDTIVWEHGRRNFALRADGVLAIVCPVFDDTPWCGIGIFNAPDQEVARIMDDDPGVRAGVFEYEIHPVRGFPGSELPA